MLVRKIKYEDFNGTEREEEFYFNLTTAELARMELVHNGKMVDRLNDVIASKSGKRIIEVFEELIHDSYGVKSLDGKSFIKTEEQFQEFKGSPAYSILFMEVVTEPGKAAEFVNGLMPADLQAKVAEMNAKAGFRPGADTTPPTPPGAGTSDEATPEAAPAPQLVQPPTQAPEQAQPIPEQVPQIATPPVQVSPESPPQQPQYPSVSPAEAPPAHPYDDPQRGDGGGYIGH